MGKKDKILRRLLSKPKDLTWDELTSLLNHFGYEEIAGSGSSRKFVDSNNNIICGLHKPHPKNIVKVYQIELVLCHLKEKGKI